jgi:hypothetical protein
MRSRRRSWSSRTRPCSSSRHRPRSSTPRWGACEHVRSLARSSVKARSSMPTPRASGGWSGACRSRRACGQTPRSSGRTRRPRPPPALFESSASASRRWLRPVLRRALGSERRAVAPPGAWSACLAEYEVEEGEPVVSGMDIGGTRAASALVACAEDLRVAHVEVFQGEQASWRSPRRRCGWPRASRSWRSPTTPGDTNPRRSVWSANMAL